MHSISLGGIGLITPYQFQLALTFYQARQSRPPATRR
jgi:hypothetical protein